MKYLNINTITIPPSKLGQTLIASLLAFVLAGCFADSSSGSGNKPADIDEKTIPQEPVEGPSTGPEENPADDANAKFDQAKFDNAVFSQ